MDKRDILQRIIDERGNCDWIGTNSDICRKCPLAKLHKDGDGEWMNCYDAVGTPDTQDQEEVYLRVASDILCDLQIEELLQEQECKKKKEKS